MEDMVKAGVILGEVAAKHGIKVSDLSAKGRASYLLKAKKEARSRLFSETGLSTRIIGTLCGTVRAHRAKVLRKE